MKNNRRKAPNRAAPAQTISALIEKPNIWSDWFASRWVGPLSWVQMAALLMRDTRPELIVDRLGPLLDSTREKVEANCRRWAGEGPDERQFELTYASYREHFLDALYDDFEGFLKTLEGNRDLEWLRDRLINTTAGAESLVWFLLNGIALAQFNGELDEAPVTPEARWLADLDFDHPSMTPGFDVVLGEFYQTFSEGFAAAAPMPENPTFSHSLDSPITDSEDPYIERLALLEARQARQAAREYVPSRDPVALPNDAWRRAMRANAWNRALDLARVPMFGWQRQIAFLLRDVSLDEMTLRTERALLEMADLTDRNAIDDAARRGHGPEDVEFGLWFKWWREHFQHWNDPLRADIERLCRPEDAAFVGDWLPRLDGVVFADFLIKCAHARLIDAKLGFGPSDERLLVSQLFEIDVDEPLVAQGLNHVTLKLFRRFRERNGGGPSYEELELNFSVDWTSPLAKDQPGAGARL